MAKFRCGVAPLKLETCRYENLKLMLMLEPVLIVKTMWKMKNMLCYTVPYVRIYETNCTMLLKMQIQILNSSMILINLFGFSPIMKLLSTLPEPAFIF